MYSISQISENMDFASNEDYENLDTDGVDININVEDDLNIEDEDDVLDLSDKKTREEEQDKINKWVQELLDTLKIGEDY